MKQKFYIIANSILYELKTIIIVEDYTESNLDDDTILIELEDICMEYEQKQYNTIIIPENEINIITNFLK